MKFLKGFLISIFALIVIWLLLAMFSPHGYTVTREVTSTSSKEAIWSHISTFEKWQEWSPWKEKDKTLTSTYNGIPGEEGCKTSWKGDPEISGTGSMTMIEIIVNQKIGYDLQFKEFSNSKGSIELTEIEGGTKIVWTDKGELPFIMRPISLIGIFDKWMGLDFERGLEKLDELAKTTLVSTVKELEIYPTFLSTRKYLGIRHKTRLNEVATSNFFGDNFGVIRSTLQKENITMVGKPSYIYYSWNETDSTTEVFPSILVPMDVTEAPEGMEIIEIAKNGSVSAIKGVNYGPYSGLSIAHGKMKAHCKGIKTGLVIEEFITDPKVVESEDDIITHIYYLIIE